MQPSLIVYKIGCWSYILVGIGHTVTSILTPVTPERSNILQEMKNFSISMAGTESNLYLFHEGFSLMMGVLFVGYGLLSLFSAKTAMISEKRIIFINTVISLFAFVISIKYFFIVPVIFLGMAFLCFSMSLISGTKSITDS